jgi:hypothetical protein
MWHLIREILLITQDIRNVFHNVLFYFFGACEHLSRQYSEITTNSYRKLTSHCTEIATEIRYHSFHVGAMLVAP